MRQVKTEYVLLENIRALLAARGVDARSLAFYVGHSQAWISKILSGDRKLSISDLGRVADFFGLTASQLLQHGISPLTERRRAERRTDTDRRSGRDRRRAANQGEMRLHADMRTPRKRRREEPDEAA